MTSRCRAPLNAFRWRRIPPSLPTREIFATLIFEAPRLLAQNFGNVIERDDLPHPRRAVLAGGEDALAVGQKHRTIDISHVALERGCQIPD
jgi:hypothetical protein